MQNYNTIIGVIDLRLNGISYRDVQRRYKIGSSTVTLIMSRFKEIGCTLDELRGMEPDIVDGKVYVYDENGNLICVSDSRAGDTTYTFDAEGSVLSCARPDASLTTYSYDEAGRLISLENELAGLTLSSFDYTYDAAGRIATETLFQRQAGGEPDLRLLRAF